MRMDREGMGGLTEEEGPNVEDDREVAAMSAVREERAGVEAVEDLEVAVEVETATASVIISTSMGEDVGGEEGGGVFSCPEADDGSVMERGDDLDGDTGEGEEEEGSLRRRDERVREEEDDEDGGG